MGKVKLLFLRPRSEGGAPGCPVFTHVLPLQVQLEARPGQARPLIPLGRLGPPTSIA